MSPFSTLFSAEILHRAFNSLYRARHNFYNKYFLLSLSILNVPFFDFNLFIARPKGIFRRLISDAKGPILNFALITLVVRYLCPHVIDLRQTDLFFDSIFSLPLSYL